VRRKHERPSIPYAEPLPLERAMKSFGQDRRIGRGEDERHPWLGQGPELCWFHSAHLFTYSQ
jgi:hypothetical protein